VPNELREDQKAHRMTVCNSLLNRHDREPFLEQIVTGDEKWVLYENPKRRSQWLLKGQQPVPTPKPGLHPRKVLLCIWWDWRGIIHQELLDEGQTVTADIYCQQLDRLNAALLEKRPALVNRNRVILQHDNARPHTAKVTQQKIRELGWEVLPHPPYSPDIAPSDYYLFRSLQHYLSGEKFDNREAIETGLSAYFGKKEPSWFEKGIKDLLNKWANVINNDGDYIMD
jgi:histone-lysine N-methyltransferase SETMAR